MSKQLVQEVEYQEETVIPNNVWVMDAETKKLIVGDPAVGQKIVLLPKVAGG